MQKVSLPPLGSGIQVSSVAQREPPTRSWNKYKKLLIDNPKDSNLLQRQKLWNFQKLNRGAFRSHLVSLPDIPYRVHTNTVEKVSVGVQVDSEPRISTGLRVIFPNLANRRPSIFTELADSDDDTESVSSTKNKACSPMFGADGEYPDDFEDDSSVEDPGFEFDTVLKKKNASTMTEERTKKKDKKKKSIRLRTKERASILRSSGEPVNKSVKFREKETADAASQTPEIPVKTPIPLPEETPVEEEPVEEEPVEKLDLSKLTDTPDWLVQSSRRELSVLSDASKSSFVEIPSARVGHSSHVMRDPLSVLDILSGGLSERYQRKRKTRSRDICYSTDPEADRVWFEKIVGDREVIDTGTYESFARTRPNMPDSTSDSNTDRFNDFTKAYAARKNFTPRVNDEFPQYHSLLAKDKKQPNASVSNAKSKSSRRPMINIGKIY